jgi:pimeloyl-ACP methyl ester carboxylesterase
VPVDGLDTHFVHARAASPDALPLILSHGWPDSFWRYSKVIPLLVDPGLHGGDPAYAFDVVVPDILGFGFSQRPPQALDAIEVSGMRARLMEILGCRRFGAVGGDIGRNVSRFLALNDSPAGLAAWIVEKLRAWSGCGGDVESVPPTGV